MSINPDYPPVSFGSPALEVRLAALIIAGRKRATVWNGEAPNETELGKRWTVVAEGKPVAVIETISVERRAFSDIDAAFASEEGEGDRSLAFWRKVHEDHFRREGSFSPGMILWCERFQLIDVLDEALAAAAPAHVAAEEAEAPLVMAR